MQVSYSLVFLGLVAGVLAYAQPGWTADELPQLLTQEQLQRVRRQWQVQGGGSPRQGVDLSVNGRVPVWQSNNGRHSIDATGQYSQHIGGPFGNSRPNWGAGAIYTFRF